MKCEWVQQNIIFYVYNELEDDARYEVEQHLGRCPECASELKASRKLHATLSQQTVFEPTPNLLASSRMRLQEALETTSQGGLLQRLIFEPATWVRQIRMSPALTAVIFILGFGGGIGATYNYVRPSIVEPTTAGGIVEPPIYNVASIAGIRSISKNPGSDQVTIKFDTVSTQDVQGSLNDQRIQQLLLFAARNNFDSGVRMDAVEQLYRLPNETHVREALVYALHNDSNVGVRLKALEGLSTFVAQDVRVRDAVLAALLNDTNPGVRMQALRLIEPLKADSSVRNTLTKLETDENASIRSQARAMLAQVPELD